MGLVTFETLWSRNVFELANLYSFFWVWCSVSGIGSIQNFKKHQRTANKILNSQHKSPGRTRKLTNGLFKGRVQEV